MLARKESIICRWARTVKSGCVVAVRGFSRDGIQLGILVRIWTDIVGQIIIIIIPTPLCPKACRTLNFLTVQENRALAGRVKNPYRRRSDN
jgi:hypothetical protein